MELKEIVRLDQRAREAGICHETEQYGLVKADKPEIFRAKETIFDGVRRESRYYFTPINNRSDEECLIITRSLALRAFWGEALPVVKEEKSAGVTPIKEDKPVEDKKPATKKTAAPKPNTPYDRNVKEHKVILQKILDTKYPGWKQNEQLKQAAIQLSADFTGKEDFFTPKGELVDSFEIAVTEAMDKAKVKEDDADKDL